MASHWFAEQLVMSEDIAGNTNILRVFFPWSTEYEDIFQKDIITYLSNKMPVLRRPQNFHWVFP